MGSFLHDVRYALRLLAKSPGFTAVAILTLALGIGSSTAIFSVINSVLLHSLPFHNPDRLVQLWETERVPGTYPFAGADYLDWQAQNRTLESSSLYTWGEVYNASGAGETASSTGVSTQANFFSVLGVQPLLGRTFATGEDQAGKNHVAVLSYEFWRRHFGGRNDAIGQSIQLNGESYSVIGVMPEWFHFPTHYLGPNELWTPLDMSTKSLTPRGTHNYRAVGRLKRGVSIQQAQSDLAGIAQSLEKQFPDSNTKVGAAVVPLKEQLTGNYRQSLLILFGAVALVLLVACANIANLLLARSAARQREMALRAVMGATRIRVVRQLLTESLLLSGAGAILGLLVTFWAIDVLKSPASNFVHLIPTEINLQLDVTVLAFAILVSIATAMLFGLAPALHASQIDLSEELKSAAQSIVSPSGWRRIFRDTLVVGEIALSLALLAGAGLLLRSFSKLCSADIGARTDNVLTMGMELPQAKYSTLAQRREFFDTLLDRLNRIPGVRSAAVSTRIPLRGGSNMTIQVEGDSNPAHSDMLVEFNFVTPGYFDAYGIPFLAGQNFSPEDVERVAQTNLKIDDLLKQNPSLQKLPSDLSFVVIISKGMAQTFWPNQNPIGKVFAGMGGQSRVIGVVGDAAQQGGVHDTATRPQMYYPLTATLDQDSFGGRVSLRTAVPPMSLLPGVRSEIRDLDNSLAVFRPQTMNDVVAETIQETTVQTTLLGIFAGFAVLLAALGLYSVMAYLVTQRTHEIGVRMVLGAQRQDVLRMIITHGSKLTVAGIVLGLATAFGFARLMAALLYGVTATDPFTFAGVVVLLAAVAVAACLVPALRATRVDPMVALRYE